MKKITPPLTRSLFLRPPVYALLPVLTLGLGIVGGWMLKSQDSPPDPITRQCLRLGGYSYINPLLVCDYSSDTTTPRLDAFRATLQKTVDQEKRAGTISSASVFFRDLNSGETAEVNPDEKYYPASLNKVPTMIAAFKMAETNPDFLQQSVKMPDTQNQNAGIEIQPKEALQPNTSYTVEQALEKMIMYSDNNAFYALANVVNVDTFKSTFNDLKLPIRLDPSTPLDYLTAKDFSYFFRVLYNATYLNRDYSQKALELLGQVDFKQGLVAGLPAGTEVAHKFGIETDGASPPNRELHDCGIVYRPKSPYLICVMTKGSGSLAESESAIKKISAVAFTEQPGS